MIFLARMIVRHPWLILFSISVLSVSCTLYPLLIKDFPTFTDPIIGFETRDTIIAQRIIAWENLLEETRPSKSLAVNPQDILDEIRKNTTLPNKSTSNLLRNGKKRGKQGGKRKKNKKKKYLKVEDYVNEKNLNEIYNTTLNETHDHWGYGRNLTYEDGDDTRYRHMRNQWVALKHLDKHFVRNEHSLGEDDYFCGAPIPDYAHLVVKAENESSLMTFENILNMCKLQNKLVDLGENTYQNLCQRKISQEENCCQPWSLPNYIAVMTNKSSCMDIVENDVAYVLDILQQCAPYFHSLKLAASCELEVCSVPSYCSQHNAVYNILFYLVDIDFLPPNNISETHLRSTMLFLPIASSRTSLPYYNLIKDVGSMYNLHIPAMDLGVKNSLFDKWLIHDTWLVAVGGVFVFICVWFYTTSFLLSTLLFVAIIYAIGVAYFIYTVVYNLEFFPFMNILVVVVVIGMGADEAFLYIRIWQLKKVQLLSTNTQDEDDLSLDVNNLKSGGESTLVELVTETLKHSMLTMLVTTLTTAVAFFASYVSHISAINCFSVFAGTAVLINYLIMLLWLPCCVLLVDTRCGILHYKKWDLTIRPLKRTLKSFYLTINRYLVICVTKLRIFWIIFLGLVGIGSAVIVFYKPGLMLPNLLHFQLFQPFHPFEQYELVYKEKFIFERLNNDWGIGSKMPLRWVWGIKATDNGNHMNPASKGHLVLDNSFNISDPESQEWLLNFCIRLKAQTFYQSTLGPLLPNCFIENFKMWMTRKCVDQIDHIDRTPCCEISSFPYSSLVFDACIVEAVSALYQTPREYFMPGVAGPKFTKGAFPPHVVALVVEFESNEPFSMSYMQMNEFYAHVENWTNTELSEAPKGLQNGWFLSELQFFDLQETLASGTLWAIGLSAALSLGVLLPTTLNLIVSFFSVLSMACAVIVTIAILVLLGWKLNVLESIAISTSAGLAVDFNLHYALGFTFASGSSTARAISTLMSSAGPTATAAITTGMAGVFLLYSQVLPYSQIGTFLALVMTVSWLYATLFLCSLLSLCGCRNNKHSMQQEEGRSASGASTICSGLGTLESHELERLAEAETNRMQATSPSGTSILTQNDIQTVESLYKLE